MFLFRRRIFLPIIGALVFLSVAPKKQRGLTPFHKNVQSCLADQIDVRNLDTLTKIYDYVADRYALLSSEVLEREVLYKVKDETRKLKFENGKLQLYKVLEDEDDRLVPVDNEVRQRSLTTEAYLTQLLIHADIRSDWTRFVEKRVGSTVLNVTKLDGEIKSLQIEKTASKKKLDCQRVEGVESCICSDLK